MMEMGPNNANAIQRVCIRCGDSNVLTRERCAGCAFDLTGTGKADPGSMVVALGHALDLLLVAGR